MKILVENGSQNVYRYPRGIGINPGSNYQDGRQKIMQAGFIEFAPPFNFRSNGYIITFLVDDKDLNP